MTSSALRAGIIIVSDTAAKDPSSDRSILTLKDVFEEKGGDTWEVQETVIVSDDILEIQRSVIAWTDGSDPLNLILTSGGTGFATKDNTPEAISPLLHKHASGLVHGMLAASLAVTPFALMSRPVAGVRRKSVVITLPGSPKGAKENLEAVLKLLPHACVQAAGADSRAIHADGVKKLEEQAGIIQPHSIGLPGRGAGHHHHHHHRGGRGGHTAPVAHTEPKSHPLSNDPNQGATRRYRSSPYPMLSVDKATELILSKTPKPQIIKVSLNDGLVGNVLAENVEALEAVPAFRASTVDGYALVVPEGSTNAKGTFPVVSVSHAAPGEPRPLKAGEIVRITTGAPLPSGATSVAMVEDTVLKSMTDDGKEEKEIEILTDEIEPGENVREAGSDIKAGEIILEQGDLITAVGGELGLLASVGRATVTVFRKPIVGVLSTGDEIIEHDRADPLNLGEVRDSNRPTIMEAIRNWGFEVIDLGIAKDKPDALEEIIRSSFRKVDVIVTSGGVSMGELDLLKPTIERSLGGTIHFGRVAMKPGKPTTFATAPVKNENGEHVYKHLFSLPGNPASAIVTLHLFVLPALQASSGFKQPGLPNLLVVCDQDFQLDPQRTEYHRVIIHAGRDGLLYANSTGMQRSSRISSLKGANGLLCLPTGNKVVKKGTKLTALLMGPILNAIDG